jgi:ABC-2 type transport system ATP-binding protein
MFRQILLIDRKALPDGSQIRDESMEAAVVAENLVKDFGPKRAVDGVSLEVPAGSIFGLLGPNGAGKTTTLRMLLGIIDPDSGTRSLLGRSSPLTASSEVGYLPEERGLYPSMTAREAIAFMGALRGLPINEGRRRATLLLADRGLSDWEKKPIRTLSKGMAQTVQLLGTLVHKPRLIVLDEPFSGLDAINQEKLEALIRAERDGGATVIFSTHVIAHAERLCERIAIIADGKVAFAGAVDEARDRLRPVVRLQTRAEDGAWRAALPGAARRVGREWRFELPPAGPEPLLRALIDGGAGIETLSIERPGLHDAFVAIAGASAAAAMGRVAPA